VAASARHIEVLLEAEHAKKVVLAGFSQGAAIALHVGLRRPSEIAGILMMSGYLLESDEHPCPKKSAEFPIGIMHGSDDEVIPFSAAEGTVAALEGSGFSPTLKVYPGMAHSVCEEEIGDVLAWLEQVSSRTLA
jgi:predicted esterase